PPDLPLEGGGARAISLSISKIKLVSLPF
ncbi:hypothetical protein VCHC78A1_00279B, partial [Vibrio cholerae HC-78A1]